MRLTLAIAMCALIAAAAAPLNAQEAGKGGGKGGGKPSGPCEQIEQDCKSAGFILGDAKTGNGLWVDCIRPIMRGTGQPSSAKIALPQVSPDVVTACKAKHPNFGEGKGPPPKGGQPPPPGAQPGQPSGK